MRMLRASLVVVASLAMLSSGVTASSALVHRGGDACADVEALQSAVADLESARAFDASGYRRVAKDFTQAAKGAPKELRSTLKRLGKLYASVGKAENDSDAVKAYGNGLVKYDAEFTRFRTYVLGQCATGTGTGSGSSGSSGGSVAGTLTLGDETITLRSARCSLEEQTAAGQKILWTGQASGTNAAGENLIVDVSRYDASSQFAGDDLSIDIGDPRSDAFVGWNGRYPSGTIDLSGRTISASGLEVGDDDLQTATASFTINC